MTPRVEIDRHVVLAIGPGDDLGVVHIVVRLPEGADVDEALTAAASGSRFTALSMRGFLVGLARRDGSVIATCTAPAADIVWAAEQLDAAVDDLATTDVPGAAGPASTPESVADLTERRFVHDTALTCDERSACRVVVESRREVIVVAPRLTTSDRARIAALGRDVPAPGRRLVVGLAATSTPLICPGDEAPSLTVTHLLPYAPTTSMTNSVLVAAVAGFAGAALADRLGRRLGASYSVDAAQRFHGGRQLIQVSVGMREGEADLILDEVAAFFDDAPARLCVPGLVEAARGHVAGAFEVAASTTPGLADALLSFVVNRLPADLIGSAPAAAARVQVDDVCRHSRSLSSRTWAAVLSGRGVASHSTFDDSRTR
ncbi:MAG: hypothetical protein LBE07_02440 [Gordonia sp. (in: high G+C Gram-positive bacteria)]|jgi:hypothetical protein|nr:hypothetical protein [Gordonia sp. (in: high G+C Gram-positive bacteria)]